MALLLSITIIDIYLLHVLLNTVIKHHLFICIIPRVSSIVCVNNKKNDDIQVIDQMRRLFYTQRTKGSLILSKIIQLAPLVNFSKRKKYLTIVNYFILVNIVEVHHDERDIIY